MAVIQTVFPSQLSGRSSSHMEIMMSMTPGRLLSTTLSPCIAMFILIPELIKNQPQFGVRVHIHMVQHYSSDVDW